MGLRDKVVVPELSAAAENRVEQRFIEAVRAGEPEPLRSLLSGWRSLAFGAALSAVAVVAVIYVSGVVDRRAVVTAQLGAETTEIVTGAHGATLRLGDATIDVGPDSELVLIRSQSGETGVALSRGSVDCDVVPRRNRPTFWVGADDVTVRVVGTVFKVSHDPDVAREDRVKVAVDRGRVAVLSNGSEVFVDAGSQWSARYGLTRTIAAAPQAPAPITDPPEPTRIDETAKDERKERTTTTGAKTSRKTEPARSEKKTTSKPSVPRPSRHSAPSDDADLLAAMELETSDPRAAIKTYTQIAARKRGAVASFALYSRAYVELIRLGDRSAALRTLDLFRRRFPKSRESESALWLQISALCKGSATERCRAAAHSYNRRYPDGRFSSAAQKIIDSL